MPISGERQALRRRHRSARRRLSANEQRQHAEAVRRSFLASPLAWRSRRIAAYLSVDGEVNLRPLLASLQRMGKLLALPVVGNSPELEERTILSTKPTECPSLNRGRDALAPERNSRIEGVPPSHASVERNASGTSKQPTTKSSPVKLEAAVGDRERFVLRRKTNRMSFFAHRPEAPLIRNRYGIEEPPPGAPWINTRALDLVLAPLVAFDDQGNRLGMGGGFYDRHFGGLPERLRPLLVGVAHEAQRADALPTARWDVPLDGILTEAGWRAFSPRMGF